MHICFGEYAKIQARLEFYIIYVWHIYIFKNKGNERKGVDVKGTRL